MSLNSENTHLTTDAFPSPPRSPMGNSIENKNNTASESNTDRNTRKHSNSRESSHSGSGPDSRTDDSEQFSSKYFQREFSNKIYETPPIPSAFANVINISNVSGLQFGSNYTYIMKNCTENHKEKSDQYNKTEKLESLLNSQRIVTEKDIQFVSTHMDETWMNTARKLDYSNGQISQFHCDFINNGIKEVIYQFLLDWIRANGKEATVRKLGNALWNTGQQDCALRWSEVYQSH